jgi:hypothetical protein
VKDGHTLAQLVDEWIDRNCPAMSADAILSRPFDAMKLGAAVGRSLQKIDKARATAFFAALVQFEKKFPLELEVVDEICRGALNLRKQSKLKHRKK